MISVTIIKRSGIAINLTLFYQISVLVPKMVHKAVILVSSLFYSTDGIPTVEGLILLPFYGSKFTNFVSATELLVDRHAAYL